MLDLAQYLAQGSVSVNTELNCIMLNPLGTLGVSAAWRVFSTCAESEFLAWVESGADGCARCPPCCGLFLVALKCGFPLPSVEALLGANTEPDLVAENPPPQGTVVSLSKLHAEHHLDAMQRTLP